MTITFAILGRTYTVMIVGFKGKVSTESCMAVKPNGEIITNDMNVAVELSQRIQEQNLLEKNRQEIKHKREKAELKRMTKENQTVHGESDIHNILES